MNQTDWTELKSGTDVRGVALEGVEGEHINLTDEAVSGIMKAFCYRLAKSLGKDRLTVAIGHDSRLSADRISKCAADAVTQSGSDVILTGLSSTPSMFMLLQEKDIGADASVMITASHLPYNKNGLKFFLPSGGLEGKDISAVIEKLDKMSDFFQVDFILSVSMDESELPEAVKDKIIVSL